MGASDLKQEMRTRLRAERAAVGPAERREAAIRVAAGVLLAFGDEMPRAVLAYAPTAEELDPGVVVRLLRESDVRVAYPRVCGPGEVALHWAAEQELAPGYCGILEPPQDAPTAPLEEIDLVLIPGVGFDPACHRLGMGGGYYDRLLPELRREALKVGLAFDEQIVEAVPHERHDAVLDAVVTPTRVLRRDPEAAERL
jgi:5-formyltetrahydrofolate cyclo-ligase